jgi:hypothetical protein
MPEQAIELKVHFEITELQDIIAKLKEYHFECQGGCLENCIEFLRLEELAKTGFTATVMVHPANVIEGI